MVNEGDGSQYSMQAVFLEVEEPERLVWREPSTGVTTIATFSDLGASRTEVQILFRQADAAEPFQSPQPDEGFESSLDRFADYLRTLTSATKE